MPSLLRCVLVPSLSSVQWWLTELGRDSFLCREDLLSIANSSIDCSPGHPNDLGTKHCRREWILSRSYWSDRVILSEHLSVGSIRSSTRSSPFPTARSAWCNTAVVRSSLFPWRSTRVAAVPSNGHCRVRISEEDRCTSVSRYSVPRGDEDREWRSIVILR